MKSLLVFSFSTSLLFLTSCSPKDMALDIKNLDRTIEPGNDFYYYANGGWIRNHPLPGEYSRYGTFDVLSEENIQLVKEILEEASEADTVLGSNKQKAGDFYKTGMDTVRIDTERIRPLAKYIEEIHSVENQDDLIELLVKWQSLNFNYLFSLFAIPDKADSEKMIASLSQGGLGLPDVDYYTSPDEHSVKIRNRYQKHIARILSLSGLDPADSDKKANTILDFETRLAKSSMTRLQRRDPFKTYNKVSLKELAGICPAYPWQKLLEELELQSITEINVSQPQFFSEVGKMVSDTDPEIWKSWLYWSLLNSNAEYLSSDFYTAKFDFYDAFLSGRKSMQPRWKVVAAHSNAALGEAIGEIFVEKHFPPESKTRMLELVENIRKAMAERITQLDWMSDSTKMSALEKLDAVQVKVGYPDKWKDYTSLKINDSSYFDNVRSASLFNYRYNLNKIGKPVDKTEWGMTPQTVNAYYNPSRNEIVFPAAILQPPFFYAEADDAVNYGAIGMVIAHELTHGFDDQGRNYDKNGNLLNWWTEADNVKFKERSRVLVDYFNSFEIRENVYANGELTLGENIADLGGLNIAYSALQKAWQVQKPAKKINGFTPSQRFFLAYAHIWSNNITPEEMLRRTREDVHSLGHLRVNGPLRHIDEFYRAFSIQKDDPMYLPEEKRASIW